MLKHHYIATLFVLLMLMPFVSDYFSELPFTYYFLICLIFSGIEFYGAYFIHSGFHLNAICVGSTNEKLVAITFDDGPNKETTHILDLLKEHKTPATFFCIGTRIAGNEALLNRMETEGHLIGNHSYSHGFFFDLKGTSAIKKELTQTSDAIEKVIGKRPLYFRPPYGVTTPALARAVKKLKHTVIGWNIRSLDTSIKDQSKVMTRIKKRLKPGSIILLHDTVAGNVTLVKELLSFLRSENYSVVSLESLLHKKAYA